MTETTEQIENPVLAESPLPEITTLSPAPDVPQPDGTPDEGTLTAEISELWRLHGDYTASMRSQSQNLRSLRSELGKRLSEMKQLLARPGRNGQWSAWLKERKISRATADRLVLRHERSQQPDSNRLTEAISEPTEEEIKSLFDKIAPKLRKALPTPKSIYHFVEILSASFDGVERRITEEGILILSPAAPAQTPLEQSAPAEAQEGSVPVTADVTAKEIVESTGASMAL